MNRPCLMDRSRARQEVLGEEEEGSLGTGTLRFLGWDPGGRILAPGRTGPCTVKSDQVTDAH